MVGCCVEVVAWSEDGYKKEKRATLVTRFLCGKGGFLALFLQYSYPLYMCFILPIIRIHDEKLG